MITDTDGRITTVDTTEDGEVTISAPDADGQTRTAVFSAEQAFNLATALLNSIRKATGNGPAPIERIDALNDEIRRDSTETLYRSRDAVEGLYQKVDALHTALDLEQKKTRKMVEQAAKRAEDAEHVLLLIQVTASRAIDAHARKYGEDWGQ
jgi:hypothetical protein